MRVALLLVFLAVTAASQAAPKDEANRKLEALRRAVARFEEQTAAEPNHSENKDWVKRRLQQMVDIDQQVRLAWSDPAVSTWPKDVRGEFSHNLAVLMGEVDRANTEELKRLLKIHRWFTITEFGAEADGNAWLLVQHADHDRPFQQSVLDILTEFYPKGETKPANYAYLWDRVAVAAKMPQRYGTQGRCTGPGVWEPWEIAAPATLEQRRNEMGLMPMERYRAAFREQHLCP